MEIPPKSPARWAALLTTWFPLWLLLGAGWAWRQPEAWLWFRPFIEPALGVVMLGMGLTLRFADFASVLRSPGRIALGVAAQFGIMPLLGWALARVFQLEPGLALGLILVACCPGGTASNVICHLARANVPLSVLMTLCSTLTAIFATPWLTQWLAGAWLPVDASALFRSMLVVVLLPLLAGISVNTLLGRLPRPQAIRRWIDTSGPLLSALVVVAIVACIIAARRQEIAGAAPRLFAAVFLLHAGGFALGYLLGRLCGCGPDLRRTLAIEVGMQNSGLGAALAARHFPSLALAPVPAAISAVFHSLIGSALAAWWRRRAETESSQGS
jgi:bile acid:Na+ symporter, BASS family